MSQLVEGRALQSTDLVISTDVPAHPPGATHAPVDVLPVDDEALRAGWAATHPHLFQ